MIELDTALIILMVEALVGLVLLAIVLLFLFAKRKKREHVAANELITRLEEAEIKRSKKLGELIKENCEIDNNQLQEILREIRNCEHALYQQILQIFLQRDAALLKEIDRAINKLANPYCRILQESNGLVDPGSIEELERAKAQISQLKKEGKQLAEQLEKALHTMDEISTEYTRVFSGKQTELELENSSKKMLRIFQEAEKSARGSFKGLGEAGEGS